MVLAATGPEPLGAARSGVVPADTAAPTAGSRLLPGIVVAAAAVAVAATAGALVVQAAEASSDGLAVARDPAAVLRLAGESFVQSSALRVGALVALVVGLVLWWRGRGWAGGLAVVAGATTVGSFAITGHSVSAEPWWLVMPADTIHLAVAAAWFGGLVLLTVFLAGSRSTDAVVAGSVIARFSVIATASVLAVGLTGSVVGWLEVRSWRGLVTTSYGKVLLAKVAIVGAVALLGLYNNRRLVPGLEARPSAQRVRHLRRVVGLESLALLAAIGVTSVLVNVVPARTVVASEVRPFADTVALADGIDLDVLITPARAGTNTVEVRLLDGDGELYTEGIPQIELLMSQPGVGVGPISRIATPGEEGFFSLETDAMSIAGTWTVEVQARMDKFTKHRRTFEVTIR